MVSSPSGTIVLPQVDSHGRLTRISGEVTGKRGDMASIAEMAKEERQGCRGDSVDRALAKGIMRDGGFQNDLEYMDDNAEKLAGTQDKTTGSNKKQKQDREREGEREEQRQKQAAVRDYRVMDSILSHCTLCFKQSEQSDGSTLLTAPAHPIIALGNQVYLALPDREPMNDGHCIIAPIEHTAGSSLRCDDDVWDEIGNFMKSLIRTFAEKNQAVVFMETVIWTEPARARHCFLECIPMPMGKAQDAPAFFREAMVEAAEEWSQHRKVIDTLVRESGGGGFRNTMTAKMPYFHVWFNPKGGMAHVIENAEAFPEWFGREVVAGMLDLPPAVYRKPRRIRESQSQRRERAEEWKAQFAWDRFDWTKMLSQ
ncbi:Pre-mRNA-splicing factor cwf19 [Kickxella alabastrina]|uniref:Pre-mRNA-splicing factor cwf19 n=1 Tax=Kickxella alabastrina TaxID=61397 RepID=A0ACC1I3R6_9FUNG|nr:Pre-mRNA-splicing factor cwf19 [Kickxella alabastrina]